MEAVIATGGKQYRVAPGRVIAVEKLSGEAGATVEFRAVLLVNRDSEIIAGRDRLGSAKVSGEVVGPGPGPKVAVVEFKRRTNYRPDRGHRQPATHGGITRIE